MNTPRFTADTLITEQNCSPLHFLPYTVEMERNQLDETRFILEGKVHYRGTLVRRFVCRDAYFVPILMMHAINDHQLELHAQPE